MDRLKRRAEALMTIVTLSVLCAAGAAAQEFRGTVTGRVTDTSGAVTPGATVTVTNVATGVAATATTNETGSYTVPYLTPGNYTVTVELMGFRKVVRTIELRVGDRVEVDAALEPGSLAETVQVTADAPLLDVTSGSSGQVIDERRIALLPLADGNPFVLARFAAGIVYNGDLKFSRPFDNAGTSGIVADGAPGGNEFMIDGSPNEANKASGLPRVAFVPSSDSVQEFKVESASYDAQQGHTAGATVNVVMKSGTNDFKGTAYGYLRNDTLSGNDFFLNRAGTPNPGLEYKHWGGTVGGPVQRNRTFFFASFERLTDLFPEPNQFTVPTAAERAGDFSALLAQNIVIYDPLTAQRQPNGTTIARTPFAGNIIPANRLNQVALNYLKYYPMPNQAGDAQGRNNYFSPQPRTDSFYSEMYRVDHEFTSNQKIFLRYYRNHRVEDRGNWTGVVNGVKPTGNFLFRINDGITADHVYTISSRTLLDIRGGWSRFQELNQREHEGAVDPASLGFASQTASLFGSASYLPRFNISSSTSGPFNPLGDSLGGNTLHSIYSFQPTLTRLMGSHSLRAGYDFRLYKEYGTNPGNVAGTYTFGPDFTKQTSSSSQAAIGQELASFMLGIPTSGSIDINTDRLNYGPYNAVFVQDDWKTSDRLTVNLGLRWEYESPTTDRLNRNLRGFDTTSPSPVEAAAVAAYTANPLPELAPANFHVRGGLTFASSSNPGFWNGVKTNFEPRAGFAYSLDQATLLRGGFGVYAVPFIIDSVNQTGFSQSTSLVPTLDNGLTFATNLTNPFLNGAQSPSGSSLGLATFLGRSLTGGSNSVFPVDRNQARSARWSIGIQRQLPGSWVAEAAYIGGHGYNLTTAVDLNPTPVQYLSTSQVRDQAAINTLDAIVANPFQGLIPGTALNGATTTRRQLVRPFPQFTGVNSEGFDGSSQFQSAQFRVERRFHAGYTLLASYAWSHFTERVSKLNATDTQYETRISENDVPHRVAVTAIWELPFGRGHTLGGGSAWTSALVGGWSVQVLGQVQSGRPLCSTNAVTGQTALAGNNPCILGNLYYSGDPRQLVANISSATVDHAFDTSGFYFHDAPVQTNGVDDPVKQRADQRIRLADNIRTFPTRLENLRGQALQLWDISLVKRFPITDRVRMQLDFQMLNAFNRAQFSTPNLDPTSSDFGKVTSQSNLPRNIQLAAKLLF
jgi:hypothetical protein